MLALERRGLELEIGSVYPPLTSLRHEHISRLRAPVHYPSPQEILRISEENAKLAGRWPRDLVEQHERKCGPGAKEERPAGHRLYCGGCLTRKGADPIDDQVATRAAPHA